MNQYFNINHLTINYSMRISRSLLKYGYSKFKLEILKYCNPAKCTQLEQFYLDLLKPSYNILQIAGSRLGYITSEETRAKISAFRNQILLGNKGRSGIYMWTNLINKKRYVGSSADLSRRFREYYDKKRLLKESSMAIYRALLKYGFGLRH
jgi:excinuclease UvrABC nuclease subunit